MDGSRRSETADLHRRVAEGLSPDFEIVRHLGRGRMAEVFLAREVALQRLVAVKVLRPELAVQEAPRKRFLREGRSAARISHPHVVSVHRVGTLPDGTPYLTMEYVDGRTMEDVVAADGLRPEAEVRELLIQISEALQAAHDEGIIHRDVRPNNIMRTRDEQRFVLTDFGVAGILQSGGETSTRLTGIGEILGEARYTAPEQLEGNPVRPESDIYSLAVTAYELLTRETPYGTSKIAEVLQAHLTRDPIPLSKIRFGASKDLEDLLLRCLAKRPEHRPPARGIARRLRGDDAGKPVMTDELGTLAQFLHELKRRRVYQVGAGYAALAFVVLQAAEVTLPALGVSDFMYRVLVLLVLAGFPVSLILAWVYDLTAGGIERTASEGSGTTKRTRTLQLAGVVLSLGVAALLGWLLLG